MSDLKKYYDMAALAEASYVLFDELKNVFPDQFVESLLSTVNGVRFDFLPFLKIMVLPSDLWASLGCRNL